MWNTIVSSVVGSSGYSMINTSNLYNLLINTMQTLDEEQRKTFVENLRINMGMTFGNELKVYLFKKLPKSELLKYFESQ